MQAAEIAEAARRASANPTAGVAAEEPVAETYAGRRARENRERREHLASSGGGLPSPDPQPSEPGEVEVDRIHLPVALVRGRGGGPERPRLVLTRDPQCRS